jgi:hypothetical protein
MGVGRFGAGHHREFTWRLHAAVESTTTEGVLMFKKTRKIVLIGGVLAAVSFGGSALAAAGAAPVQPTHVAVTTKATAAPVADKETADGATDTARGGADKETADGAQGSADAQTARGPSLGHEEADEETSDGGSAESETGSEAPGNDGSGGHADEPGNPNAQHEAGGQTEE